MVRPVVQETQDEVGEPTATEVKIAKFEAKIRKMAHIDARSALIDYMFPILRLLAKDAGDHQELIEELTDQVANGGQNLDQRVVDTFENTQTFILKLLGTLDAIMVAAGFMSVNGNKLQMTDKVPKQIAEQYAEITKDVPNVVSEIKEAVEAIEAAASAQVDDDALDVDGVPDITPVEDEPAPATPEAPKTEPAQVEAPKKEEDGNAA